MSTIQYPTTRSMALCSLLPIQAPLKANGLEVDEALRKQQTLKIVALNAIACVVAAVVFPAAALYIAFASFTITLMQLAARDNVIVPETILRNAVEEYRTKEIPSHKAIKSMMSLNILKEDRPKLLAVLKYLKESNVDFNKKDGVGLRILYRDWSYMRSETEGVPEIYKYIIKGGYDINPDENGEDCFLERVSFYPKVVRFLLEHGNFDASRYSETMQALILGRIPEKSLRDLLIEKGFSPAAQPENEEARKSDPFAVLARSIDHLIKREQQLEEKSRRLEEVDSHREIRAVKWVLDRLRGLRGYHPA